MLATSAEPRLAVFKGKRFESLEEAQAYLDRWETNCADTRIHAPPNGKSPPCLPKKRGVMSLERRFTAKRGRSSNDW
jgi:hypothetical protein